MMITIGAYEAKTTLSALLEKVEGGEEVVITRHGRPIARLTKAESANHRDIDATITQLKEIRQGVTLGGLDWKLLRDAGRK